MQRYLILIPVFLLTLLIASGSLAQYFGPGGERAFFTVKEILENPAGDSEFVLKGRIVFKQFDGKYTFADNTGQITVNINDKLFPAGEYINDRTLVEIKGKVERELIVRFELAVKSLKVLKLSDK